jgi:hypothetical protein
MKIPKNKTIKVYWHDHTSQTTWQTVPELKELALGWYKETCVSHGTCVVETKDYIVLAADFDGNDEYGNTIMIMKSCIDKIKVL